MGHFRTALGIEFRESTIAITSKCATKAQKGKDDGLIKNGSLMGNLLGMTFQVSIGLAGLENPDGKDSQSKTYALFIGDTVLVNEVKANDAHSVNDPESLSLFQNEPCTVYTSSKKDLSHIAIILKDDESHDEEVGERPAIPPRRAATTTTEKNRVNRRDPSLHRLSTKYF
jgi:nucleosome binding factor SPN SPT16 subunit